MAGEGRMEWQVRMASRGRMGLGVRTGLDCCPAELAIWVRASNVAQKVRGVQMVRWVGKVGAGTWLISLELATP